MALSYENKDKVTTETRFLSRVNQAVAYHANYLKGATPTAAQLTWIHDVFEGGKCTQKAANMARELVQDAAFATATDANFGTDPSLFTDVNDAALQGAVDVICEGY